MADSELNASCPNPAVPAGLPPLPRFLVPVVVAAVLLGSAAVLVGLFVWLDAIEHLDPQGHATARLDAVKIALSVAAGGGALFALWLGVRRQRTAEHDLRLRDRAQAHVEDVAAKNQQHQDRVAAATERDADARRITELYTKAAEQLGSAKAPVRLAGLYALERLAQDNPSQRPTIVNVLCAYLRMPYDLPDVQPEDITDPQVRATHREQLEEREVRLAAQRILTSHLRPGPNPDQPLLTFWDGIDLNLDGATLIDINFAGCHLRAATFTGARFSGMAWFNSVRFGGRAAFSLARFDSSANFDDARFDGDVWFTRTRFSENAAFRNTRYGDDAWFAGAQFWGEIQFAGAHLTGRTRFGGRSLIDTWARFDPGMAGHELPAGHWVFPVDSRPEGCTEGKWGHLVETEKGWTSQWFLASAEGQEPELKATADESAGSGDVEPD